MLLLPTNDVRWDPYSPISRGCVGWWQSVPGLRGGVNVFDLMQFVRGRSNSGEWNVGAGDSVGSKWRSTNRVGGHGRFFCDGRAVSFWFNTTSAVAIDKNYAIGWGSSVTTAGTRWAVSIESGVIALRVYSGAVTGGSGFNDGKWHHCVVTHPDTGNTNNTSIYVDGVSQTPSASARAINTSSEVNVRIAQEPQATLRADSYFNGALDAVRLYSRQLLAPEVRMIFEIDQRQLLMPTQPIWPASLAETGGPWPHHIDAQALSGGFSDLGI